MEDNRSPQELEADLAAERTRTAEAIGLYEYDAEDNRTPEELEADLAAELEERVREAETGPTYSLEEVWERSRRRRIELYSRNELMKTSTK